MEAIELYLRAAEESANLAYEWAQEARRTAKAIDPIAHSGITIAINFLLTLLVITLLR